MVTAKISVLLALVAPYLCTFIHGPAKMILLKAEDCQDVHNLTVKSSVRMHMYNRTTQVVDANFSIPFDIDHTIVFNMKCSRLDKKQNSFTISGRDACHVLTNFVGDLWLNWEEHLGIPPFCPIKKGSYSVKNFYLDLSLLKIKTIFEGFFYSRVIMKKDEVMFFCMDFEVKLEQKI
ncbi:uncharacterized protein LOC111691644 [Anoplophora glabripennis]|uniref:uncharacterized protein LOC111691644 n=1 Tax=Anoplophora glabripennis TaxID=217634 RepID=UPI000C768499|nr:uncharacterized protein LOC111691644 [Anoplophora glabripennis]